MAKIATYPLQKDSASDNCTVNGNSAKENVPKKILIVNAFCGVGSTGRICEDIKRSYEKEGYICRIAYGRSPVPERLKKDSYRIGSELRVRIHGVLSRITDRHALYSKQATREFLKWADEFNPDILWLHNLHGYYLDYEMLFDWIKKRPDMQVKWTLHDCWAFTGHCAHFTMVKCDKWKEHCGNCPQKDSYPKSIFRDGSAENFDRKRTAFTGVKKLEIIVPSKWLAGLVRDSFLREYPVKVCYNKIDREIFKPTPSDFREKYGLKDKYIVLGVASVWNERKGLNDFIELAKMLDDKYTIVLVGLTDKQIKSLPHQIKGLRRTNDANELAVIYSAADKFVNTSREETFGMTTVEAQSCGTDTIVYKGSACEEIAEEFGGIVIEPNVKALYKAITGTEYTPVSIIGGVNCDIICIPKTYSAAELAQIYTAADAFANPTHEDNYPTVNLEAKACGTWVITYDVGGSRETLEAV